MSKTFYSPGLTTPASTPNRQPSYFSDLNVVRNFKYSAASEMHFKNIPIFGGGANSTFVG